MAQYTEEIVHLLNHTIDQRTIATQQRELKETLYNKMNYKIRREVTGINNLLKDHNEGKNFQLHYKIT